MKKILLFIVAALLLFIAGASPGWGQGVSTPDDLIWVAPDSSSGPALFFSDDLTFVTSSFDGLSIELRNALDGSLIKRSLPLISSIDKLYLSPDNKLIGVLLTDNYKSKISFYVLDAVTLEIKYQCIKGENPRTWDLAFSNNSKKLYRISDNKEGNKLCIYDVYTWQILKDTLINSNCRNLGLHPKDNFLAFGRLDGKIEFRDTETLILQRIYDIKEDSQFFGITMSPDGNWFSFKNQPLNDTPAKDLILNTNDLTIRDFSLTLWGAPCIGVKFSKDSRYLVYFWQEISDSSLRIKRIIDNQFVFYYNSKQYTKFGLNCWDISNDNNFFLSLVNNKLAKIRFRTEPTDVIIKNPDSDDVIKPNPGSNIVEIGFNSDLLINRIDISNETGNKVSTGFRILENIHGKIKLDVSGLNNGMYFVTMLTPNSMLTKKLFINR
jgi:hypothetical protein